MTTLSLSSADAATLTTDALVIAIAPAGGRKKGAVLVGPAASFKAAPKRRLEESLAALGATGKAGDLVRIPGAGISAAPLVLAVGIGEGPWTDEAMRRAAGAAVRSLAGTRRALLALPAYTPEALEAVGQGALLGGYAFHSYRVDSRSAHKSPVDRVSLQVADAKDPASVAAVKRARTICGAVNLARDLVNTPAGDMVPTDVAAAAVTAAAGLPIDIEVLDEVALAEGGYGGILGVGKGSANPPRLVRLAYRPEGATAHVALVGKGITFDTGGISIKPSLNLHEMKSDMGGAAAVLAATVAVARLGVPVNVTTYLCLAENIPSGSAQRPGDVLTNYGGKTVEVLDTDAEGRLVLGDGLVRAQEDKPDVLIDVATLTGAQGVALGARTSGIMSNDDGLRSAIHRCADRVAEPMWPMPQPEEARAGFDSTVADLVNIPTTNRALGGMMSASVFLKEYIAKGQRWAHLDIARPAFNPGTAYGYTPTGGTGHSVRTLVQVAEDAAAGQL